MLDKIPKEGFEPTRDICRSFLQFEEHGVVLSHEAKLLEDAGFLKSKSYIPVSYTHLTLPTILRV